MLVDFARLKRLSSTNFSWENNLPTFQLNAAVIIKAKVKRYIQTNIAIYSHVLLRIHVIGGQRSVRIAPPSQPPYHRSQETQPFASDDVYSHSAWL